MRLPLARTCAPYDILVGQAVSLTVVVRIMQPSGQAVEQPSTYSTVLGSSQPHGSDTVSREMHVGTGQGMGSHPPGRVCIVTVGHGVGGGLGRIVVTLVMTRGVLLVDVDNVVEVDVDVGGLGLVE